MNSYDWKANGFLDGLSDAEQEVIVEYLQLINMDDLYGNKLVEQLAAPVIKHILLTILNPVKYECYTLADNFHGVSSEKVLELVDVDEILKLLYLYCSEFIPVAKNYLDDIDSQAELTVLFCKNYVFKLINKII